jgi:hypothetical protein
MMFAAVLWVFVWMIGRARGTGFDVPRLAVILAWLSLVIGAVFGVILGLFQANGEVPGLSADTATRLADAHPPTMVVGYLILAGVGVAEWLLRSGHAPLRSERAGVVQTLAVFLAGVLLLVGLIVDSEPLLILNGPFELIGLGIFFWRLRKELAPRSWSLGAGLYVRLGVVGIVVSLAFLLSLVQGIASGRYATEDDIPFTLILAMDHVNFVGIMTNLTFGAMAAGLSRFPRNLLSGTALAINAGLALFVIGIAAEITWLKRVGTPVLGIALLLSLWVFGTRIASQEDTPASLA